MAQDRALTPEGGGTAVATHPSTPTRVDRYAKRAVVASALGYAVDGFDLLVLGFAIPAIRASFGISNSQAGLITTVTLIGAVLGGAALGILSDYIGRVKVLAWSIVLFAIFTGLTALSQNYSQIMVFRFIAGIGLGGEFGIGMALVTEAWPARRRARATALVGLGWQSGVLLAALIAAPVIGIWGWRGLFALGAVPALIAFAFRRKFDEPPKFAADRGAAKRTFPLKLLVADRTAKRSTIGLTILCSVQNFGYYGIITWLPTYLSTQFGYTLTKSALWTAVTVVGMMIGIWIFGQLADRIGRRPSFWIFQAGAVVSLLVYSQLTAPIALLIGGAVMGAFVNGMLGGYGALAAELYPTAARATAQNVLFNIGRGVGGFGPYVIPVLASAYSFSLAIALLAVIYVIDMFAMFLIPERRGAELT